MKIFSEKLVNKGVMEATEVLEMASKIARADIKEVVEINGNSITARDSDFIDGTIIQEASNSREGLKIKLVSKIAALDKLGIHHKLWGTDDRKPPEKDASGMNNETAQALLKVIEKETDLLKEMADNRSIPPVSEAD